MRLIILSLVFLYAVDAFSQGHIAPCNGPQEHTGGICYGYAMGRAAGRSAGDPVCDPMTFYRTAIDPDFFEFHADPNLSGLQVGDIVHFTDHAAYVATVGNPIGTTTVDQYSTARLREEKGVSLNNVKTEFGSWDGYYRKKQVYITVQNNFAGGHVNVSGSIVSAGSNPINWWGSPYLAAVDRQNILDPSNGVYYIRVHQSWYTPDGNTVFAGTIFIIPKPNQVYRANFLKEFNITFQNSFVSIGNGGVIKVNGTQYNSPTAQFHVVQPNAITGEAIYQVSNGIEYLFDHWSDGSTSSNRIFTPTDHSTYTAYFVGRPLPMVNYGLHHVVNVGQNIHLVWNDHPNTNVTQYQIWRKVKHSSTGTTEGPTLLTTLNRGTTSWTDYDYIYTSGYTDDLLSYDVRAYYRTEGTYANESWVVGYGKQYDIAQDNSGASATVSFLPNEYSVVNYPNPFNPSTTIRYALPKDGHVMLKVYDMLGREMMTLVNEEREAGSHEVRLDGTRLGSGVYLCRITAGGLTSVMKISLMK